MLELASQVRAGHVDPASLLAARGSAAELDFSGAELLPATAREQLLERWYSDRIRALPEFDELSGAVYSLLERGGQETPDNGDPSEAFTRDDAERLDALFAHHQRHRLLAVTRGRATGADALNAWLHDRFDVRFDVRFESGDSATSNFHPGEPVMMLRNDYDRGLWNGDLGLVVRVREPRRPPRLAAVFKTRGRWTAWHLASLGDSLSLAFALTVHKAQGSEYDDVALVLPEAPLPLLTRELLYTALTRSRQSVIVCGPPAVLAAASASPGSRSSGIAERLAR